MSEFTALTKQLDEALAADDSGGGYSDRGILLGNVGMEAGKALRRGEITEAQYHTLMGHPGDTNA